MGAATAFKNRGLFVSYQHGAGESVKVSTRTYSGSHEAATAEQMNAFFDACAAITADTIIGKGYTDKYDVIAEA